MDKKSCILSSKKAAYVSHRAMHGKRDFWNISEATVWGPKKRTYFGFLRVLSVGILNRNIESAKGVFMFVSDGIVVGLQRFVLCKGLSLTRCGACLRWSDFRVL